LKALIFFLLLILCSANIFSQENVLQTGIYRIVETDSCTNKDEFIKLSDSEQNYCLHRRPLITSNDFDSVKIITDTTEGWNNYTIIIKMDSSAGLLFGKETTELVGKKVAFVINDKIIMAPVIRDPILSGTIEVFCDEESINEVKKALNVDN
jgi:preprotein translocase subunit SecD